MLLLQMSHPAFWAYVADRSRLLVSAVLRVEGEQGV